jgi:hypothetical protein
VKGSGATIETSEAIQGVSVNSALGLAVEELTAPNSQTGYPGILNNQIGVTTVDAIRARGGDVVPTPTRANPHHAILGGIDLEEASRLFRPTILNPSRRKKE